MRFRKPSLAVWLIVVSLSVYTAITLVSLQSQNQALQDERAAIEARIVSAEQEKLRLKNAIATVDTDEGVEEIARAKLGLAIPGEIIFHDVGR